MLAAVTIKKWARPLRLAKFNDSDCAQEKVREPLAGPAQEDRSLALALSLLSAAFQHILKNRIPSLLMPPQAACSTTKGSTVCGCTLPNLTCFIAVAAMSVASGMWHAAGTGIALAGQHA